MEIEGVEIVRLELKYCERCGALWLRAQGTGGVYCVPCEQEIPSFPLSGRAIARPHRLMSLEDAIEGLTGMGQFSMDDRWGHA